MHCDFDSLIYKIASPSYAKTSSKQAVQIEMIHDDDKLW